MMFTARMVKLFAVVLDGDADRVTEELLREGVMQFINISRIEHELSDRLADVNPQASRSKVEELRRRIESFLTPLDIHPDIPGEIDLENRTLVDLSAISGKLDRIADELGEIRESQRAAQQEILKLEDLSRQVEMYGLDIAEAKISSKYSFISLRIGKVPVSNFQTLNNTMKDIPSVILPTKQEGKFQHLLLIFMRRDIERVERILEEVGWDEARLSSDMTALKPDIVGDLEKKIRVLRQDQDTLRVKAKNSVEAHREELSTMWKQLRVNELFYKVQSYFKQSSRTMIFSGWLPSSKQKSLEQGIRSATADRCYLEWYKPEKEKKPEEKEQDVPVQFKNPKFLAPFQMLVTNFGVPEYRTIDPTPFVMFSYLIMFGLMFADVGQGAVLALIGILGVFLFKQRKAGLQNLAKLIVWCGSASVIFGVLFGSYFGVDWVKPLWFDFHGIISGHPQEHSSYFNDIFDILKITIFFGIGIIGCGLLFNWINLAVKRRWKRLILDKGGLLGGWIYFGGIFIARYMVQEGYSKLPDIYVIFWLVGLPAIFLYAKGPLHFAEIRRKNPDKRFTIMTPIDFAMEWIVELLEVFAGYLSNTLSFMRVAGLGIAHVSLMLSFFELARMAKGSTEAVTPWSILIIIVGNILVIGLEGLTAGIQALRLNYYEFFTKFYSGSGEVYSPISLRSRD